MGIYKQFWRVDLLRQVNFYDQKNVFETDIRRENYKIWGNAPFWHELLAIYSVLKTIITCKCPIFSIFNIVYKNFGACILEILTTALWVVLNMFLCHYFLIQFFICLNLTYTLFGQTRYGLIVHEITVHKKQHKKRSKKHKHNKSNLDFGRSHQSLQKWTVSTPLKVRCKKTKLTGVKL